MWQKDRLQIALTYAGLFRWRKQETAHVCELFKYKVHSYGWKSLEYEY